MPILHALPSLSGATLIASGSFCVISSSWMKAGTILFFALVSVVQADLKWDRPQQNFTVKPGETAVVAKYRFTNAGKAPVTIDAVRTSCGCTTATLVKKEYLPGESGEIEARFEVGNRVGHQEKTILVT